jgi:hypothetical protein
MGCLLFFMLGALVAAMGVYMGSLVTYFVAFVTVMAGYLGVFGSAFVGLFMFFFS